jgi:hypothetical protein
MKAKATNDESRGQHRPMSLVSCFHGSVTFTPRSETMLSKIVHRDQCGSCLFLSTKESGEGPAAPPDADIVPM